MSASTRSADAGVEMVRPAHDPKYIEEARARSAGLTSTQERRVSFAALAFEEEFQAAMARVGV